MRDECVQLLRGKRRLVQSRRRSYFNIQHGSEDACSFVLRCVPICVEEEYILGDRYIKSITGLFTVKKNRFRCQLR